MPKATNALPTKIGGYKPTQQLGKGAMGKVYLCHDPSMDRMVVVKQMHEGLMSQHDIEARFIREATVMAHLNHPNIIQPHALWKEKDGNLSLSMEFVHGKSLREILDKCCCPPIWVVMEITYQILLALDHAHRQGVIHRDLKPANMMVDKDGRVRLLDFGVAHAETEDTTLTIAGSVIGTATYMSPEQTMGYDITPASDLFSIGIVLSEMLIGKNLFRGENVEQTAKRIQKMKLSMEAFPKEAPKKLCKLALKLLSKKAKDRPISACDAADALSHMMKDYPRDLSPYLAEWIKSTMSDSEFELQIPTYQNKTKFVFVVGISIGLLVASSIAALIHFI